MSQSQGSFDFNDYNPHPVGASSVLADYSVGASKFKLRLSELILRNDWQSFRVLLSWVLKKSKMGTKYLQLKVTRPRNIENMGLLKTPSAMDSYSENLTKKEQKFGNSGTLAQEVQTGFIYKRGLLLTPTTREEVMDLDKFKARMEKYPNGTTMPNLATQIIGLLPTPTTQEPMSQCELNENGRRLTKDGKDSHSLNLGRMVSMGMLPTPSASDVEGAPKRPDQISQNGSGGWTRTSDSTGTKFGAKLQYVAPMLPTPATRDYKGARSSESLEESGRNATNSLPDAFSVSKKSTQLSPFFVMEMMGFNPYWTLLPFTKND